MFVQVLGDSRVISYWIDTLVLKTEGNTYATLLHHRFLFKGKPMLCSRGSTWFSYWFDNLGFISEGNTYRRYAASSLPLWGNTDVVQATSEVKSFLSQNFEMKDLGVADVILNLKLLRDNEGGITLLQSHNAEKVFSRFGYSDCTPSQTPYDPSVLI